MPSEKSNVGNGARERAFLDELWQAWVRTAVQIVRMAPESKPWAIGVTSAVRGEGRTSSAIGLSVALASETVEPVVLVDADLRNPDAAKIFGLGGGYGLDDYLENRCTLGAALASTRMRNLAILPAGVVNGRHSPSLDAPFIFRRRLPKLLAELRESFAYMVFDMPPLLQDANTAGIASELDGVVLVTQAGFTELHQLEEGTERLAGANVICTVNIVPPQSVPAWAQRLLRE
jgi:Mrp family chromosome partitioning ATPase